MCLWVLTHTNEYIPMEGVGGLVLCAGLLVRVVVVGTLVRDDDDEKRQENRRRFDMR